MKRISMKILLASLAIFLISTFILRKILEKAAGGIIPNSTFHQAVIGTPFIIGMFISVTITVILFIILIEKILIHRVKELNDATKEVILGNYDFQLEVNQKDEISNLTINFNKMMKDLHSNEYLNKEFVRNFSHEIKTPLSAIIGYAELIRDSNIDSDTTKDYLKIIIDEATRLSYLSKDMLAISLVDSKTIIKQSDQFNVAEQIRNAILISQLDWEKRNLELNLELENIDCVSNKELTYQIWTNLINNAIKFSNSDKELIIKLYRDTDNVIFEITNEGDVIYKDEQERVFDLFYISDKTKNKHSSGVGLTLTKKIVKKLNGEIAVSSCNSKTTFTVTLPIINHNKK